MLNFRKETYIINILLPLRSKLEFMAFTTFCRLHPSFIAACLVSLPGGAIAADSFPALTFSGFATAGIVRSSEERADFTLDMLQENGAGRTRRWSAEVDSRLAGQVTAEFSRQVSAVAQVLVEQQADGDYDPYLEWANLKYQVTPELALVAGRIVLPVFLLSDYRKVGYAQPWVRPPVELYGIVPLSSSDGVHAMYRFAHQGWAHTVQFSFGKANADLPGRGEAKVDDGWLLADTVEYGPLTLHAAYARAKLSMDPYRALFDGYRDVAADPGVQAFFPAEAAKAASLIAQYEPEKRSTSFYGIGATYDTGNWFFTAETGRVSSDSIFGKRRAWYASTGYRMGAWTPYVIYAKARSGGEKSNPGLALPTAEATALNAALNASLASIPEQNTASVGVRWDVSRNMAMKLQFDRTRITDTSFGSLTNYIPGTPTGTSFSLISATFDMVF